MAGQPRCVARHEDWGDEGVGLRGSLVRDAGGHGCESGSLTIRHACDLLVLRQAPVVDACPVALGGDDSGDEGPWLGVGHGNCLLEDVQPRWSRQRLQLALELV
jgi:hypothetical protein